MVVIAETTSRFSPAVQPLTVESVAVLACVARKAVCFIEFTDADWKIVVPLGTSGLLQWPINSKMISVTANGLAALKELGVQL